MVGVDCVVCRDGVSACVGHALCHAVLICEAGLACVGLAALFSEL